MKKQHNEKIMDVGTGLVLGLLGGLHYPVGEYHMILVIAAVVLGLRFLTAVQK